MSSKLSEINLLPKFERRSTNHFSIFISIIIALILAYGILGIYYFTTKSKLKTEEATYTQIHQDNEVLRAKIDNSTSGDEVNIADIFSFIDGHDMRTSYFLEEIDELLPDNSYLSEYVYDNYNSELIVHFETLDDVARYTTNLTDSPFSNDLFVDDVSTFKPLDEDGINIVHIPRYETRYTIDINKDTLRGVLVDDE